MTIHAANADGRWMPPRARVALIGDDADDLAAAIARLRASGFTCVTTNLSSAMRLPAPDRRRSHEVDVMVIGEPLALDALVRLVRSAHGGPPRSRIWTIIRARRLTAVQRRSLLKAGADYVMAMPAEEGTLPRLVQAALTAAATSESVHEFIAAHKSAAGSMVSGIFEFRTLEEAERIAAMLAINYSCPEKVATGIWELLSNAVEHGNLEISYDRKAALLETGDFMLEIERRLHLHPYAQRTARVEFERTAQTIVLRVSDQGPGFDFARFLNADIPMERPNGRGISIAKRMGFGRLTYKGCGNIVEVITDISRSSRAVAKRAPSPSPWPAPGDCGQTSYEL